jgi:hypothetical protein
MKFINPLSPTENELREWAKNPEAEYPEEVSQDWDLIITGFETAPTLLKLANEDSPNRKFFLACLYLLAGDCVRSGFNQLSVEKLKDILSSISETAKQDIHLWAKRTLMLFEKPETFKYDDWCYGNLAYKDENA